MLIALCLRPITTPSANTINPAIAIIPQAMSAAMPGSSSLVFVETDGFQAANGYPLSGTTKKRDLPEQDR